MEDLQNPINSDTEILEDYYEIQKLSVAKDGERLNNILKKYNYDPVEDDKALEGNVLDFKGKVNSDQSLTWRRIKSFDLGLLDRLGNKRKF